MEKQEQAYRIKRFEEIYHEMQVDVFGNTISATDANAGGVLCSLLEAVARVISEAYLHCQIGYSAYLNDLVEGAFGVKRKIGTKAKGFVIFSCEKNHPAESDITLSQGIEIASGDIVYVTTAAGKIEKGKEESKPIPAEAQEIGEKGNVPAGSITTILSGLHSKIKTVRNVRAFENGTSRESDAELRKRFIHYMRGLQRTNYHGIKEAALRAGAYHVNVVLCTPPKSIETMTKDTAFQSGFRPITEHNVNCAVYVCDERGECSVDLIESVKAVLRGNGTAQMPGFMPAGVHSAVCPIKLDRRFAGSEQNLELKVKSLLADKQKAMDAIKMSIVAFFQTFEVGQSLILSDLIVTVRQFRWVVDVIVVHPKPLQGSDNPAATNEDTLLVVREEDIKVTIV